MLVLRCSELSLRQGYPDFQRERILGSEYSSGPGRFGGGALCLAHPFRGRKILTGKSVKLRRGPLFSAGRALSVMKLICAWCGVTIDRPGYGLALDPNTSHGMCPDCSEAVISQERGESLQRHIDRIPIPIFLVDGDEAVVAMNAKACEETGKKSIATGKQLFGQVFDCIHSRLPQGCGRTIHCSGCAIRRSIVTTFDTGEPQIRTPATLNIDSRDRLSDAVLAVTTLKRDGVILLRVEKVEGTGQ